MGQLLDVQGMKTSKYFLQIDDNELPTEVTRKERKSDRILIKGLPGNPRKISRKEQVQDLKLFHEEIIMSKIEVKDEICEFQVIESLTSASVEEIIECVSLESNSNVEEKSWVPVDSVGQLPNKDSC